jgi:hypothetical protein
MILMVFDGLPPNDERSAAALQRKARWNGKALWLILTDKIGLAGPSRWNVLLGGMALCLMRCCQGQ